MYYTSIVLQNFDHARYEQLSIILSLRRPFFDILYFEHGFNLRFQGFCPQNCIPPNRDGMGVIDVFVDDYVRGNESFSFGIVTGSTVVGTTALS